jgi:subtilisin-like proprotein convertase family protein/subtilisin family serine protease
VLLEMRRTDAPPVLFGDQWYLAADLTTNPDVLHDSDVDVPEAWEITRGSAEVVVAVIDDGFDLGHPALQGVRLHPDRKDFVDGNQDPEPSAEDYHGTPVSSIAVGQHRAGSAMRGVAPECTFLPIRIGFGPAAPPIDILEVFRYVSARADVVNCSFGLPPSSFDRLDPNFRSAITRLTQTGGRRGKGLVMVFSAANDDAPTFLDGARNVNGVRFTGFTASGAAVIQTIPAGKPVFSGYPMTSGIVTVGAMSSLKRKSGYSSWGPHLTVTAPSNNMHYIMAFVPPGTPGRDAFVANYRGLGQVAAANRPGHGSPFSPIGRFDDPTTPELQENIYTRNFGGTSGAAPVVTGVAALMISANPELSAQEVRQILMSTADRDLDPVLDLVNDPNVQGLPGIFTADRSLFFGSGKVNVLHAVRRARSLRPDEPAPEPPPVVTPTSRKRLSIGTKANLDIPDNQPQGIASQIEICASGRVTAVAVEVDITHPFRGDLNVTLVAPNGRTARLHRMTGAGERDLKRTYDAADTPEIAALVAANVDVHGRWSLQVSDNLNRDVGRLNTWFLDLEFQSS